QDEQRISPWATAQDLPIYEIAVIVPSGAGGTGSGVIFNADEDGRPSLLFEESAELDLTTTGTKTAAITATLLAGALYWVGVWANGTARLRIPGAEQCAPVGVDPVAPHTPYTTLVRSVSYGGTSPDWTYDASQ